ncbi:GPI ethanolamine phosphate transferase 1-like [Liolophura sinensis]|uniref:GPI ethanolamine phosphate transferase 1-like n=1 Tax=Liolophura sinensis TaxID=3198878 RepID=UPI00315837EA
MMWLVICGLAIHLVFFYSIFDIYFTSPLVHGMTPFTTPSHPPAKRLVLFVADGLRADKFFEVDPGGVHRAPYIRTIIEGKGSWGVSHTRVPTESRPGHVALIAGFYEDVSAVAKGWKENPVEFDSVFNESLYTWSWGSPDILPMFAKGASGGHVYTHCYDADKEDFTGVDSHKLDMWVFGKVKDFFRQARENTSLLHKLKQDKIVFFLHLLGLDTNGHSNKPYSREYLSNIRVVDKGIQQIEELVENFYGNDGKTAYVLSADHGMTDWGSHGAGDPSETLTPLVVWGAGLRGALPNSDPSHIYPDHFSTDWHLDHLRRHDVQQADVAALMSSLIGVPFPLNSVGRLPLDFLNTSDGFKSESLFTNAQQILAQFKVKMTQKQKSTFSFTFRPYQELLESKQIEKVREIRRLIQAGQHLLAIEESKALMESALKGLNYYQTYDRFFLGFSIVCGFLGWMAYVLALVIEGYSGVLIHTDKLDMNNIPAWRTPQVTLMIGIAMATVITIVLFVQSSPLSYYIYCLAPVVLWTCVLLRVRMYYSAIQSIHQSGSWVQVLLCVLGIVGATELVVWSFFQRELLSIGLVTMSLWLVTSPSFKTYTSSLGWLSSCLTLAVFPLLPVVGKDTDYSLVLFAGCLFVLLGIFAIKRVSGRVSSSSFQESHTSSPDGENGRTVIVLVIQTLLLGISTAIVRSTSASMANRNGLPLINQILSWTILGLSLVLPLFSSNRVTDRLVSITLSIASPGLLLSIRQEGLFLLALTCLLYFWVRREQNLVRPGLKLDRLDFHEADTCERRLLEWADLRRAYFFVFLILVAFFGTGNIASINSFEPASVYCFLTTFNPFLMGALMVWKNLIPFVVVTCWFRAIHVITNLPTRAFFLIVFIISDILALHFFFLVRDYGSWLDIGTSISHYVIVMSMIIFVVLLFGLGHVLTLWRLPRGVHKQHPH